MRPGPTFRQPPEASWVCPRCHRTTYHPMDVAEHYCPCCGSEDELLPKSCEHRPEASAMALPNP